MYIFNVFLMIASIAMMVVSIAFLHTLHRMYKGQTYNNSINQKLLTVCLVMLYVFTFGFGMVAKWVVTYHANNRIFTIIAVIFLCFAMFIALTICIQIYINKLLVKKGTEVMMALVNAIDLKDAYTRGHSLHVHRIVKLFCAYLPPRYTKKLNVPMLLDAALLHDIGKISTPDSVLNKEGPLNDAEWMIMKSHPLNGKKLLYETSLRQLGDWILYHHERMDGQGYYAIAGNLVPIESRIIAIADTFSALYTNRSYRKKFTYDRAMEILGGAAGNQLDVDLVDIFTTIPSDKLIQLSQDL